MPLNEFSSSDREVIRFLFSDLGWCDLYELNVRFELTPAQVLDIVERLSAAGFAELNGIHARLTPAGREWVLAARRQIFFAIDRRDWAQGTGKHAEEPFDPANPYLPDLRLVDREFFLRLALENEPDDDKM